MKEEYKRILALCKEFIDSNELKKLEKIEDYKERTEGLKYLIDSKLRLILLDVESKLDSVDKKESLILESRIRIFKSKIKIFHSTYSKRDFHILQNSIEAIKEEMKNVGVV